MVIALSPTQAALQTTDVARHVKWCVHSCVPTYLSSELASVQADDESQPGILETSCLGISRAGGQVMQHDRSWLSRAWARRMKVLVQDGCRV
jgi:hypothetical protein